MSSSSSSSYRPSRGGNEGYSQSQRFHPYRDSNRDSRDSGRDNGRYNDRSNGYGDRRSGGYGSNGGYAGFAKSGGRGGRFESKPLVPIDWSQRELESIQKDFSETMIKNEMEKSDIDSWRKEHAISISVGFPEFRNKGRKRFGGHEEPAVEIPESIKNAVDHTAPIVKFQNAGFPHHVLGAVQKLGFEKPTPIQSQSWPLIMSGKDVIGIARTGSGKTVAFLLPVFTHMAAQQPLRRNDGPICVIIAPTRELAQQICKEAEQFTRGSGIRVAMICGGMPKGPQIRALRGGVEVLVITPGRAIDFLESGLTNFDRVSYLVIDEADRLLDMGFEPSLKLLVSQIRPDRQTLFFSATWPKEVHELARQFLDKNEENICQIGVGQNEDGTLGELKANPNVTQIITFVSNFQEKKLQLLNHLPNEKEEKKVVVFVATKKACDSIAHELWNEGFAVDCIHGDKSQPARDMALRNFKRGKVNVLVATDVASRGIHVDNLETVVNFDFPSAIEDYVHRIGRTGRAGNKGTAVAFFDSEKDGGRAAELLKIMKSANQEVPEKLATIARNVGNSSRNKRNRYYGGRYGGGGRGGGRRFGGGRGGRRF